MRSEEEARAPWKAAFRRFRSNRAAMIGALFVLCAWTCALLAPVLTKYDPAAFRELGIETPGAAHWLGTDALGRDVLSRLLYGARVSLGVGWLAVAVAASIGTAFGLLAGYAGGWVDTILMRLVDLLLAFPRIFLALLVIALWGPSIWLVVIVLGLTGWMSTARMVRAQVLSVRQQDFVLAARAVGLPLRRILLRHVLPNSMAPVLVAATLMVGNTILAESVLSFLGLGVQIPDASWGSMLNEARESWRSAWWLATFPGVAITLSVVAHNLLGDGVRDLLDPRLAEPGKQRGGEE